MANKLPLTEEKPPAVFDVANWLDRATSAHPKATLDYVPKHRADGPAD